MNLNKAEENVLGARIIPYTPREFASIHIHAAGGGVGGFVYTKDLDTNTTAVHGSRVSDSMIHNSHQGKAMR